MLPEKNIFGDKRLNIVKHAGDLKVAYVDGDRPVYRSDKIFIQDIGLVNCAPYNNHFVFRHLFDSRGWSLWCSCGSPAGVVGYDAYQKDASKGKELIVCLHHAGYSTHLDGSK